MSADAFASVADVTIPAMAKLLEFVWRRQVAAGIQRSMMLRSHGLAPGPEPGPGRRASPTWSASPCSAST